MRALNRGTVIIISAHNHPNGTASWDYQTVGRHLLFNGDKLSDEKERGDALKLLMLVETL